MLNHNSVLEIENLSFSYTQNALKKDVLKSLCARFYGGEICGIWLLMVRVNDIISPYFRISQRSKWHNHTQSILSAQST
ncbi:hypothetical protein [Helicobacter fennelliae]|uniref:hypothetical protein n=1 Tax=Helicobacter fennelliae TaxID=215 RepID=UPI000DD3D0F0|nr:hypothetical protein [Helicobacter fennelliae]